MSGAARQLPSPPHPRLRRYQAVRWDEPLVTELGAPGARALALPPLEPAVAHAGAAALDRLPAALRRTTPPNLPQLSQPEVVRHFLRLSQMTLGAHLTPDTLGTCTMKYSPIVGELIARSPAMTELHPEQDPATIQGLLELVHRFDLLLREVSGFDAFGFQGGGGSLGIFTSALIMRACHESRGELEQRREIITTAYSHPANAAGAAVAGFRVITLMPGERGYAEPDALRAALSERTAGLMLTNPEDTGIFNPHVAEFVRLVHEAGGLCAYDQANGNPLLGVARARDAGFDLGQFNLHKTFGAPHNSIGPGCAAVGVRADLARFLPAPVVVREGDRYALASNRPDSIGRVRSFAGNLQVVVRAYAWLLSLGAEGLRTVAETAVLNNNYLATRLATIPGLSVPYEGSGPRLDQIRYSWKELADEADVGTEDLLRRTTDYGVQPYTTSHNPMLVPEPMTLEPTEMMSRADLDELAAILARVADEARTDPALVRSAPHAGPIGPLDEAAADDPARWAMTWRALQRKWPAGLGRQPGSGDGADRTGPR
ncbi:MAG TPA: aminomethyl-transferring glycine dehydrogenase subunit GcvPB [Candidatus Saccharimonadales bacterium]|nr:aminomethyl-transferring glycine dehydrogenase subunit GcvPB [Candidatus Saccharimonadales bacterium]